MTKKLLTEIFNFKIQNIKKKDGTTVPIAYIDKDTSESVFNHKDILKKHGAQWDAYNKRWYWWLSSDKIERDKILNDKVNPAIDYLISIENNDKGEKRISSKVQENLKGLLDDINNALTSDNVGEGNSENVVEKAKESLQKFKDELLSILNDEDFKNIISPIIKFRSARGYEFSFLNTILIFLQDKEATLVKSSSKWKHFNRTVNSDGKAIALWTPLNIPIKKEEKERRTIAFLKRVKKNNIKDLTPSEKEELDIELKRGRISKFVLSPHFYDVRFTTQIEGTDDEIGDNSNSLKWFDDETPETERTSAIFDATIESIKELGIKLEFVDDLDGARGVSKNGAIDVLTDSPKNLGSCSTLIHELGHELLHQNYLRKSEQEYAEYFVGREEGRAVVEQQAELTAWIVLRHFDFDIPTNINYMALWGIDDKKASIVFDTVAYTATKIYSLISSNLPDINEDNSNSIMEMTGRDLAKLLGDDALKLYDNSKVVNEIYKNFQRLIK